MAHQTHNIPWSALATTLELTKTHPHRTPHTDERVRILTATRAHPAHEKRRAHFARVFAATLAAFAATERRKYPADPLANCPGPRSDPVVFAEATQQALAAFAGDDAWTLDAVARPELRCARWWKTSDSGYGDPKARVVMAMVGAGEVLPLLRLAAWKEEEEEEEEEGETEGGEGGKSPLMRYWSYGGPDPGWGNVMRSALQAYVFFNVVICWEELWMVYEDGGDEGGKVKSGVAGRGKGRARGRDYRDSKAFAKVVSDCTRSQDGNSWVIPHREFYGGEFGYDSCERMKERMLDPLHPAKMERMRAYLKMCWEHLVRVHMILEEAGQVYDWEFEVKETICWLWGHHAFPKLYHLRTPES